VLDRLCPRGSLYGLCIPRLLGRLCPRGSLYGLCIPSRLGRLYPRSIGIAYVYLDGWADYSLGVLIWLMYTSTPGQIIDSEVVLWLTKKS
jgi:hypothetical protein